MNKNTYNVVANEATTNKEMLAMANDIYTASTAMAASSAAARPTLSACASAFVSKIKNGMKVYIVDCISRRMFFPSQVGKAKTPKEAAEKVVGRKVCRVKHGGDIVVGSWDNTTHYARYRSYVYEVRE